MKNSKDTIYIDVDDEITSIIDKVQNTTENIVALVLPKRAAMLQSSVNMKLLKRAADKAKKNIVLITTEAGLLPLANAVGIHVAKNLQSKPAIPSAEVPASAIDEVATEEETEPAEFDPKLAANQAIGELATDDLMSDKPLAKPELAPLPYKRADAEEESVMLDNSDKPSDEEDGKGKEEKTKGNKKLKVPNFDKFRLWLFIIIFLVILLIGGFFYANSVLPKAAVNISTNTSTVSTNLALILSPTVTSVNTNTLTIPAKVQQSQQTASKQVTTTGQKNEGQQATGTVSFQAVVNGSGASTPSTIPAGVGISSGGLTFITQQQTVFSNHVHSCGSNCFVYYSTTATSIVAQNAGLKYNLGSNSSPATFTSSYQDSNNNPGATYSATGSTSGGTDNNVQVVSQTDINNATQAITMPPVATIKATIDNALKAAGYYPIVATYTAGTPAITQSANVGDQTNTVTVTETVTYFVFGVHENDLTNLLDSSIDQQINTSKQSIQDTGLSQGTYTAVSASPTQASLTLQTNAVIGPLLNISHLKTEIEGEKKGDLINTVEQNPGVTSVTVKFSPFWVSSVPKNTTKITITVKKAS